MSDALADYRCPVCRGPLEPGGQALTCARGHSYAIDDEIPVLVRAEDVLPPDAEVRDKYDDAAASYDVGIEWLFRSFHADERQVREAMLARLEIDSGNRVLEVGAGTGRDTEILLELVGEGGVVHAQDISLGMLRYARARLATKPALPRYAVANASQLPFADDTFDAVYHFGGINTFAEAQRAVYEMTRVTRPGGKVVFGDEGVAPWLRDREYGRILRNANPLYDHEPPLHLVPETARDVTLNWILGNAFYVVDYRVGDGPIPVALDLPIPGPRGGTLRSRWEAAGH